MFSEISLIFSIAILIMSVVAHEVSHGYVAYMLGDPTAKLAGRLTLNPLKHIDPVGSIIVPIFTSIMGFTFGWAKPVPYNQYNLRGGDKSVAVVALAGPVMNIFIAFVFGVIIKTRILDGLASPEIYPLLIYIVLINFVLAIFNLTPIPPFDGSKVLFSFLPYNHRKIEEFLNSNQLILLFIFLFFIWGTVIDPIINTLLVYLSN
ncbi:MAG: Peptidase M50 [Parcubacteria group bacterium GW2011_GWF2_38_76]|nr:MAG: Peptidase M50 [Parcubacteria group bacterium GW2011_GWF2_38_76]HBM45385.1 site-2 protease family protein [Patescibacteria group bacterium]